MSGAFRVDEHDNLQVSERALAWTIVKWTALFVVMALVIGFITQAFGLVTMPWVENKQTEIVRNTNQYINSDQTHLISLITQYDKLNTSIAVEGKDPTNADVVKSQRAQEQGIADDYCNAYNTLVPNFRTERIEQYARLFGCKP